MTYRPLIAVTTTMWPGGVHNLPRVQLNAAYITAVEAPGAAAVPLTPAQGEESIRRVLGVCHGLLLTGGEDVDPARYGQQPHEKLGTVNRPRDRMEVLVLEGALERGLPVLAICRGIQLLNVALGGTLFQDLPSQRAGGVIHEQEAPINERWHAARVAEDSQLAQVIGATDLFINSFHHQGIDRLAPSLRPVAWSEDGLVEAVESTEHPWVVGVQWHPERGEAETPGDRRHPDQRLFWAFVEAAKVYATERLELTRLSS